ncbi:hypothetical protein [Amycolatopsis sp. EV170708-02-1]|uniref:hypothetical protein n=1 Tax=Amycolatopsis sp. EV170708-02-1 TaxID=2919322 RepID=UPI001F0BE554|nr:hypothetical protein [Amycolatopsis sp. EV170708-02-1]UMP03631.1 hypothetical protein MJQ72_01725 [Amycolatopsis sp. EV170708-02-1]
MGVRITVAIPRQDAGQRNTVHGPRGRVVPNCAPVSPGVVTAPAVPRVQGRRRD